jgi:hypothetical protein
LIRAAKLLRATGLLLGESVPLLRTGHLLLEAAGSPDPTQLLSRTAWLSGLPTAARLTRQKELEQHSVKPVHMQGHVSPSWPRSHLNLIYWKAAHRPRMVAYAAQLSPGRVPPTAHQMTSCSELEVFLLPIRMQLTIICIRRPLKAISFSGIDICHRAVASISDLTRLHAHR